MRTGIAVAAAFIGLFLGTSAANATFHLVKVREVAPASTPGANDGFVELQMYAAGQNLLGGHTVRLYGATGIEDGSFQLSEDALNGGNQRTFLIGDDATPGADFVNAQLSDALGAGSGGAVCFEGVDCVAWGSFTPPMTPLPSPAGSPAPAIPAGMSITRSIAPGCATLLEAADDTDNSATDFSVGSRTPRSNSVTPTETPCAGGGGGGGAPDTAIVKAPKRKTSKTKAKFKFRSDAADAGFECKRDRGRFKPCTSPRTYKRLDSGKHRFKVRAVSGGETDPTPAKHRWKVLD